MGLFTDLLGEQGIKKLLAVAGSSLLLTLSIFYLMQYLIAVGDIELGDKAIRIETRY